MCVTQSMANENAEASPASERSDRRPVRMPCAAPQTISSLEEFRGLDRDIEGSAKRWRKLVESECP